MVHKIKNAHSAIFCYFLIPPKSFNTAFLLDIITSGFPIIKKCAPICLGAFVIFAFGSYMGKNKFTSEAIRFC